jgi:predicted membrane protein
VDDVSWGALALSLTVLGGIYTWWALRHRGFTAAVRAAGITLLPLAAWMTGLLEVFGDVADSFAHWFTRLVFSPLVWLGMIVFVVAVVLIGGANAVSRRIDPKPAKSKKQKKSSGAAQPKAVSRTSAPDPMLIDDEMAEIQAILKKRGIS